MEENIITWNSKNEWSVTRYESKDLRRSREDLKVMLIILLFILSEDFTLKLISSGVCLRKQFCLVPEVQFRGIKS